MLNTHRDTSRISIGLSATIPKELDEDGLDPSRLTAFVRALAVELLRAGARLVHGSHPTILPLLREAAEVVRQEKAVLVPRVTLVLSRARGHYDTAEKVARLRAENAYAHIVEVPAPGEAIPSPAEALLRLRRDELVPRSRALVCVGGELHLTDGIRPGVEEEARIAEEGGLPVYLLAAGGGYTRRFFQARADRASVTFNGLTPEENDRLGWTLDAHEAASLVVRGLQVVLGGRAVSDPRSPTHPPGPASEARGELKVRLAGRARPVRDVSAADSLADLTVHDSSRGSPRTPTLGLEAEGFVKVVGLDTVQVHELPPSEARTSRSVRSDDEGTLITLRAGGAKAPDDVVELEWESDDGGVIREWVAASELETRFHEAARGGEAARGDRLLTIPTRLMLQDTSRGLKEVVLRAARRLQLAWNADGVLDRLRERLGAELGKGAVQALAGRPLDALTLLKVRELEGHLVERPGLYTVDDLGTGVVKLAPYRKPDDESKPLLVLIHGTASNTLGGFDGLWASDAGQPLWSKLRETFGRDGIVAFEHWTLSQSPTRNALDLLKALPSRARLYVLTHSRGGLVGELLCLDPGAPAPSTTSSPEVPRVTKLESLIAETFREGPHAQYGADVRELVALLKEKQPTIERFVRVACPAAGTTLASGRLDRYLGGFFNVLSLAAGSKVIVPFVKSVLLAVVGARTKPDVLPGLEAMIPESPLVRFLGALPAQSGEGLLAVAGDFDGEGALGRLKGLFADLYYWHANDFVVDTDSMLRGIPRSRRHEVLDRGPTTDHFSYFRNRSTLLPIHAALSGKELPPRAESRAGSGSTRPPTVRGFVRPLGGPPDRAVGLRVTGASPARPLLVCVENRALQDPSTRQGHEPLYGAFPIVVGFFVRALLMGPAAVIDRLLGGELSDHLALGLLPCELGASRSFTGGLLNSGALVVGLGEGRDLTRARLTLAFEQALRSHAGDHLRHWSAGNPTVELVLDTLLLGQSFLGDLSVRDTVRGLVRGAQAANRALAAAGQAERVRIIGLRIVEHDECLARAAERELRVLAHSSCVEDRVEVVPPHLPAVQGMMGVEEANRLGRLSRVQIEVTGDELRYDVLSNLARAERVVRPFQRKVADLLLEQSITRSREGAMQALFQYLIPIELSDGVSADTLLVLDGPAAALPWELMWAPGRGGAPLATEFGLVRQLRTLENRRHPRRSAADRVLIIGEPAGVPSPLPHARREANQIGALLGQGYGFQVRMAVGLDSSSLLSALYEHEYDVIHVAAHGATKDATHRAGILIGGDLRLTSVELNQLCAVPSLVFLNCCHLAPRPGQSIQDQSRIAADLAQDLIQIGVRVVIAAGWAVNDHAATTFAETLYDRLLSGTLLMDAVRDARATTRDRHPHGNTWGAYQVYGDPGFVFTARR